MPAGHHRSIGSGRKRIAEKARDPLERRRPSGADAALHGTDQWTRRFRSVS